VTINDRVLILEQQLMEQERRLTSLETLRERVTSWLIVGPIGGVILAGANWILNNLGG
jgi:hypothetical protein